jgi:prepilin-type N-terminal cleavage/methylation domain-containing protein
MTIFNDDTKGRVNVQRRRVNPGMAKIGQAGFSLLEMLFAVAILTIVMAVVFNQINLVQKRSRVEDTKLDLTQESREFMDQVVRDMHSVGFPTQIMYPSAAITDGNVAAGLVKIAYDELWFEGDVDGDGQVDVIDYKLQPGTGGKCPCTISRSQYPKAAGTALLSQTNNAYNVSLTGVINSGGGGAGTSTGTPQYAISGSTVSGAANDTVYSSYKNANLFTYYNSLGGEILPTDINSTPNINTIVRTIQININVLGTQSDLKTGIAPVMSYSAAVRMPNQ